MKDQPRLFRKEVQNCGPLCPAYVSLVHLVYGEFKICREKGRVITSREGFPDFCELEVKEKEEVETKSPTG